MARTRTATTAPRRAPAAPRRVSGHIRPGHPRPVTALPPRIVAPAPARGGRAGSATGVSERLRAIPDHRWLDGLLRSRAWIWILGIALGGIVAMQVSLLSMNAGIGRDVQTSSDLQHANAKLAEQVAELSGGSRIEAMAGGMGLTFPLAGDVGYLTVRPEVDAVRAAQNMIAPSEAARARLAGTAATAAPATGTADPAAADTTTDPSAASTTITDPAAAATTAPVATATPAPVTTPAATPAATAAPVTETPPVTEPVNSTAGAVAAPAG